jgi:transmembrane sensor
MEEQLAKFFAGEANEEEKKQVLDWRGASAENAEQFILAKAGWIEAGVPIESDERILKDILQRPETKIVGWPSYLKYAAAVVLLAMFAALWYFNGQEERPEVYVFNGTYQELEDGSIVSLKKGSILEVLEFSDELRKVKLTGKAFFEVKRDEDRPFQVVTTEVTVSVLGTSFQVIGETDYTEICVESGLVSVVKNNSRNKMSVNLATGEMGMTRKATEGIVKRKIGDQNFLAWKSGILNFERTKTIELIKTLSDVYGANIHIDESLMDCKLTAQFSQKNLEEVIQILSATFNWTYEINQNNVVLSGDGC